MVGNHTLGVARGARRVVQGNRIPFVSRQFPLKVRAALGNEVFVADFAKRLASRRLIVFDFNHKRAFISQHGEGFLDHT